jgi:hypothetical protein
METKENKPDVVVSVFGKTFYLIQGYVVCREGYTRDDVFKAVQLKYGGDSVLAWLMAVHPGDTFIEPPPRIASGADFVHSVVAHPPSFGTVCLVLGIIFLGLLFGGVVRCVPNEPQPVTQQQTP